MWSNGLETALECVGRGWPVVPGALWVGDGYVDPVTDAECDALALSSPAMATVDPEEVRRLWPVSDGGVTRSALAVVGTLMTAVVVEPEPARWLVGTEAFRASPTPVVMLPVPTLGLMIESAVFVVSSAEGLDEKLVFPRNAMLPLPPTVVEGHRTQWLVSPVECDGLMSGPELAGLLETSNRR
ncbi:hypothetical protein LZG04_03790 [Saccharothrix sp. S26]|uniref:hypothetical protein n=1 Tax=Saccharothrix sp. S26 TaxID=2907215 RepID=UPI001F1CED96|nr:hypothetical protein [Saccharothrix sp. S26]MCE6993936.1 hypothetical protein [Saccharothrix sp. S26]